MRSRSLLASFFFGLAVLLTMGLGLRPADAKVRIAVDLTTQTMHVTSDNGGSFVWPVSTARGGFVTPRGVYGVQSLQRMHYSRKYNNAPMPHSIFFRGGYAIHATNAVGSLGRAASHGCVRLAPGNAATLYRMVAAEGAQIIISGSSPSSTRYASDRRRTRYAAAHRRHHNTAYAARRLPVTPTAYAPLAPSYDQWIQNPLGSDN